MGEVAQRDGGFNMHPSSVSHLGTMNQEPDLSESILPELWDEGGDTHLSARGLAHYR